MDLQSRQDLQARGKAEVGEVIVVRPTRPCKRAAELLLHISNLVDAVTVS